MPHMMPILNSSLIKIHRSEHLQDFQLIEIIAQSLINRQCTRLRLTRNSRNRCIIHIMEGLLHSQMVTCPMKIRQCKLLKMQNLSLEIKASIRLTRKRRSKRLIVVREGKFQATVVERSKESKDSFQTQGAIHPSMALVSIIIEIHLAQ